MNAIPSVILSSTYSEDSIFQKFLTGLPEAFEKGEGELLYDGRNKIRRFVLPSGLVAVVKAYKRPNAFQRLCYSTFWKNKATKAFLYGEKLREMGIDTPEPMAAVTYRDKLGRVDRYYFVSAENDDPDCFGLNENSIDDAGNLIDDLMAFLIQMHEKGFLHGDTNLSNFLYKKDDGHYRFAVIDTNRSHFLGRPATKEEVCQNLSRLTHVRPLLTRLVASYARQRGWNADEIEEKVLKLIVNREKKKKIKRKLNI